MPRSGDRSKTTRGTSRKAASTLDAPTSSAPTSTSSFVALAPPDQGGPVKTDEEELNEEEGETAGAAGTLGAAAATISSTTAAPPGGAADEDLSLAEDLLAVPITLPTPDPVRIETAAHLRTCMMDCTRMPAWVMELVLPGSGEPVGGPTAANIGKVRVTLPQQNLDVGFERVQNPPMPATPIQ